MQSPDDSVLDVSRETAERLRVFLELLERWGSATKLVSSRDRTQVETRHVADSLRLIPFLRQAQTIADLGSGAGFPGLILAIVTSRPILLIEANNRKAAFLLEAIRVTSATASVAAMRIEDLTETFDLITARAVAPLDRLLPLVSPRLKNHGRCLFPKGREHAVEIEAAARQWDFTVRLHQTHPAENSPILEFSDISRKFHA